jgi:hypothetical protein
VTCLLCSNHSGHFACLYYTVTFLCMSRRATRSCLSKVVKGT